LEKNPRMQVLRDLRARADAYPACTSPFGVENMTGNMDEPVAREASTVIRFPFESFDFGGQVFVEAPRRGPTCTVLMALAARGSRGVAVSMRG
jgi:hypothetical protein